MNKLLVAVLIAALVLPMGVYAASLQVRDLEVTDVALSKSSFNSCEPLEITATVKENYNPVTASGPAVSPLGRAATVAKTGPTTVVPEYKVTFYYYRDVPKAAAPSGETPVTPTIGKQPAPAFDIRSILRIPILGRILQPFVAMPTASAELIITELPKTSDTGEAVVKIGEATVAQHSVGETGTRTVTYKYWATPEYDNYVIGAYVDLANADGETNDGRKNNKLEEFLITPSLYSDCLVSGTVTKDAPLHYTVPMQGGFLGYKAYASGGKDDSYVDIVTENTESFSFAFNNTSYSFSEGSRKFTYRIYERGQNGQSYVFVWDITGMRYIKVSDIRAGNDGTITGADICVYDPEQLQGVDFTNPNGGETYIGGMNIYWCAQEGAKAPFAINWGSTDPPVISAFGSDPAQVKSIAGSVANNLVNPPYAWDIKGKEAPFKGAKLPDGKYKLYINSMQGTNTYDETDGEFSISTPKAELGGAAGEKLNAPQGGSGLTPTSVSAPNIRPAGTQENAPLYPDFQITYGPMVSFTRDANDNIIPNISWGTTMKSSSIVRYGLMAGSECLESDLTDTYSDAQKAYTDHIAYLDAVTENSNYCFQALSQTDEQTDSGIQLIQSDIFLAVSKPLYAPAQPAGGMTPKLEAKTFTRPASSIGDAISDFFNSLFGNLPDLAVSRIGVVQTDHINTITITIKNRGKADAYIGPGLIRNKIPWLCWQIGDQCIQNPSYINGCDGNGGKCTSTAIAGTTHCVCRISAGGFTLKAGESKSFVYTVSAPESASDITAEIDPDNTISELSKANNALTKSAAP